MGRLSKAALQIGPQFQWNIWFREETRTIGQWNRARGVEISPNQFVVEGDYANIKSQTIYNGHILPFCHAATLNT